MASFRPETFTKIWHLGARFAPCRNRETLGIPTKPRKRRRFPNNAETYTRDGKDSIFSECALNLLGNWSEFDSAIRRFERKLQPTRNWHDEVESLHRQWR